MSNHFKLSENKFLTTNALDRANEISITTISTPLLILVLKAALGEIELSGEEAVYLQKVLPVAEDNNAKREKAEIARVLEDAERTAVWKRRRGIKS